MSPRTPWGGRAQALDLSALPGWEQPESRRLRLQEGLGHLLLGARDILDQSACAALVERCRGLSRRQIFLFWADDFLLRQPVTRIVVVEPVEAGYLPFIQAQQRHDGDGGLCRRGARCLYRLRLCRRLTDLGRPRRREGFRQQPVSRLRSLCKQKGTGCQAQQQGDAERTERSSHGIPPFLSESYAFRYLEACAIAV